MSESPNTDIVKAALKLKPGEGREEALSELTLEEKESALESLVLDGLLVAMSKNPKASLITESRRFLEEARSRRQKQEFAEATQAAGPFGDSDFPSFSDSSTSAPAAESDSTTPERGDFPSFD